MESRAKAAKIANFAPFAPLSHIVSTETTEASGVFRPYFSQHAYHFRRALSTAPAFVAYNGD
jgi:hypothetical protein